MSFPFPFIQLSIYSLLIFILNLVSHLDLTIILFEVHKPYQVGMWQIVPFFIKDHNCAHLFTMFHLCYRPQLCTPIHHVPFLLQTTTVHIYSPFSFFCYRPQLCTSIHHVPFLLRRQLCTSIHHVPFFVTDHNCAHLFNSSRLKPRQIFIQEQVLSPVVNKCNFNPLQIMGPYGIVTYIKHCVSNLEQAYFRDNHMHLLRCYSENPIAPTKGMTYEWLNKLPPNK